MKKILVLITLIFSSIAFSQVIKQGETQINAGVGLSNGNYEIPIYAGLDFGFNQDISFGGRAIYANYSYSDIETNLQAKTTYTAIEANCNYHFNDILDIIGKWDVYAGATFGASNISTTYNTSLTKPSRNNLIYGIQLGSRYYFTENIGVNLEIGGTQGFSGLKLGVSYKL